MPTKFEQRKTAMTRRKTAAKSETDSVKNSKKVNNGQTIKNEPASAAIATITANIAATKISINDIDNTPIIEEERVPEDNALVRLSFISTSK